MRQYFKVQWQNAGNENWCDWRDYEVLSEARRHRDKLAKESGFRCRIVKIIEEEIS